MNQIKDLLIITVFLLTFSGLSFEGRSEIRPARIFSNNMILQRDTLNKVWGFGEPGEQVRVTIAGQEVSTVVTREGQWEVVLDPVEAGGPYTLTISGDIRIELNNILFGEVWLCSGQSNMQYTLRMLGKDVTSIEGINNPMIRQFKNDLDVDYLPKEDLKGGRWEEANGETTPDFSAVAYFFGKVLYDSLRVPIGLINTNLGATTVETWMSRKALIDFPQFSEVVKEINIRGKNFSEMNEALTLFRKTWDDQHYLVGPGLDHGWFKADYDDGDWKKITIPNFWEYEGLEHDGAVWFRKTFDLPPGFSGDSLQINLNQIDDYDITWVNGVKVGETFGNRNFRSYKIPAAILKSVDNTLVVRVFDVGGLGGFHTAAFWGNPILLGEWKYKPGRAIDTSVFPVPDVPNGSLFSYPTLLYNGNIAPVTKFSIRGAIWYQGESNASRAVEYKELLPALIRDWRDSWGYEFPFLVVQLANYGAETKIPGASTWAELREAQMEALSERATCIATAIDIGEANDIHPHNKEDVGLRLALCALKVAYHQDIYPFSPQFKSMKVDGNKAILDFRHTDGGLVTRDKYGNVTGFEIAGEDQKFHFSRATLINDQIIVSSDKVPNPVAVRYAWSDNPGPLTLYNIPGLPMLPFRTDDWKLSTEGKKYDHTPHQF